MGEMWDKEMVPVQRDCSKRGVRNKGLLLLGWGVVEKGSGLGLEAICPCCLPVAQGEGQGTKPRGRLPGQRHYQLSVMGEEQKLQIVFTKMCFM